MTRIMGTSHEDQYTLMIISRSSLLRMRKLSDKILRMRNVSDKILRMRNVSDKILRTRNVSDKILRMRNVSDKIVEKMIKKFMFCSFFFKSLSIIEIM
jgi:hypothetical protein